MAMRKQRSLKLIANFVDGFAEGWHFAVGEFFKIELDIKLTERVEKGKKVMMWTQGPFYCFDEGNMIYDTPKAYLQWAEALKHINLYCQVQRAIPNKLDEKKEFINGFVSFTLNTINKEKTGVENIGFYHLSQNNFVEFLKTGKFDKEKGKLKT